MTKRNIIILLIFLITSTITAMGSNIPHIRHFCESDGLQQSIVECVIQDSKGYIWIGSWNGLSRYDGYSFRNFKTRQGDNCPLPSNRITFIRETANGNILCKCKDGFYIFDIHRERFTALPNKKSDSADRYRPTPQVRKLIASLPEYAAVEHHILCHDRQHGYWVFTHRGLDRVWFGPSKISPSKEAPEGEEFVRAVFVDGQTMYIADKNGYLRIANLQGHTIGYITGNGNITTQRRPFGANIYCIFKDSRGTLWMGSKPSGLFRLTRSADKRGFRVEAFHNDPVDKWSINCNSIYSIIEDSRGRIILGTYGGGINIITDPQQKHPHFVNRQNLLRNYPATAVEIHDICEAPGHVLLIATNKGFYTCSLDKRPQETTFFGNRRVPSDSESLSNDQVMSILQTRSGAIYLGTYGGGINKVSSSNLLSDNIRFKTLTTDDGMLSDVVLNLTEAPSGNIWTVSEHSIMEYSPRRQLFTNYSEGTFLDGFSFSEMRPVYLAASRTLLLGTTQGLISMNTVSSGKSSFVPPIRFDCTDTVSLSPDDRSMSITFSALDLNATQPIQYAYMLEGVDHNWLYTTDHRVNLSNIPAGTFRLRVRSTNGDGVWVDNERFITICRTPHFNERPVAWMLYGALALLLFFAIMKAVQYTRRLERELKDLRLSSAERIEYLKASLSDMVSAGKQTVANGTENVTTTGSSDTITESAFHRKAEEYISKNLSNTDFNVSDFAQEMGMSRSALYIQMKKEFGCTPNNYIADRRLQESIRLLRHDHSLNISEVAYKCGFADPKYFSRCIKKATGRTPSEIREERVVSPYDKEN